MAKYKKCKMNKIAVFLFFILFFNFSKSIEVDDATLDKLYDSLVEVLKGMCKTGKNECAEVFVNNKDQLITLIKNIMEELSNGTDLSTIILKYAIQLLLIDNIGTKCNIIYIVRVVAKFQNADGIRDIGKTIKDNADELFEYFQKILGDEATEVKLYAVGKIFSLLFSYYVN